LAVLQRTHWERHNKAAIALLSSLPSSMKRFTELFQAVDATTSTNAKVEALRQYFVEEDPCERCLGAVFVAEQNAPPPGHFPSAARCIPQHFAHSRMAV
jgi:hypothetical protein